MRGDLNERVPVGAAWRNGSLEKPHTGGEEAQAGMQQKLSLRSQQVKVKVDRPSTGRDSQQGTALSPPLFPANHPPGSSLEWPTLGKDDGLQVTRLRLTC